jgi:ABC-type nitrate/sulfonate/bicarbonate transport system substrate-binding protein
VATRIRLCPFAGPETAPIQYAQEAGLFAAEGVEVVCEVAMGSIKQMVGLVDGAYDMAMTAVDNVVAYNEGQGAATPKNVSDLVVLLGNATDPRPLVARPDVKSFADLHGARIAVDAVDTGFSYMLRQLLEDHGLGMADYELIPVGAIKARLDAVQSGDCAAGLLGKDDAARLKAEGYTLLGSDPDPWDDYQGGVYTSQRAWAEENADAVKGFIRAVLAATDWVLDPANAADLPGLMARHLPHMYPTPADAARAAAEMHSPVAILKPGLPVSMSGMQRVLALRAKYGTPPKDLKSAEAYMDMRYYEAVAP